MQFASIQDGGARPLQGRGIRLSLVSDSLLDDSEWRTAKRTFWCRYRLRFPTEMYPIDAAVSRVSRADPEDVVRDIRLEGQNLAVAVGYDQQEA
jgi:hypothetical protein